MIAEAADYIPPRAIPRKGETARILEKPQFANLCDLSVGAHSRGTSYVGTTNEVKAMIVGSKDKHRRWPGFWYELIQGAWDYNDWNRGPPEINIYYEGSDEPVSLYEFMESARHSSQRGILGRIIGRGKVAKVEVCNYIRKGTALRPRHVVLTEHDAQDAGAETLGLHGRGLSIASTAATAGEMAESISYLSYADDMGTWYGEARVEGDPVDPSFPKSLQLRYKNNRRLSIDRTVVSVEKPNEDLMEALAELPGWFLPVNPRYWHQRMEAHSDTQRRNRLTVFAQRKDSRENEACFTPSELKAWGHAGLEGKKSVESPRVEILSGDIFPDNNEPIDFVFVDGLRVKVDGAHFSQRWAFWGFSGGKEGYNPKRSNESLSLVGGVRELIGSTLARCENEGVFYDLMRANYREAETYEGNMPAYALEGISVHRGSQQALTKAWIRFRQSLSYPDDTRITPNSETLRRADREKLSIIHLSSSALVKELMRYVPGLESADSYFEKKAAEERKRHEEEMKLMEEKHSKEREVLEAKRRADLEVAEARRTEELAAVEARRLQELANAEAKRLAEEQAHQEELARIKREKGVILVAKDTGEVLKITAAEKIEDTLELAKGYFLHVLAMDNGRIRTLNPNGKMAFETDASAIEGLPVNTDQLGNFRHFIYSFVSAQGNDVDLEIRIVRDGKGVYFKFWREREVDEWGNITIRVQRGTIATEGNDHILIEFTPHNDASVPIAARRAYSEFQTVLVGDIQTLLDPKGRIDIDKYIDSEFAKHFPPALALIRRRRMLREAQEKTMRELAAVNEVRVKAGLPLITYEEIKPVLSSGVPQAKDEGEKGSSDANPSDESELLEGIIIGDGRRNEGAVKLHDPETGLYLSTRGKNEGPEEAESNRVFWQRVENSFRRNAYPDFILVSGENEALRVRGYLISHINPANSGVRLEQYQPLDSLPYGERQNMVTLVFPKKILASSKTQVLYCPPGFEPAGFYHPDGFVNLQLSGIRQKNVYSIFAKGEIPAGLVVYYRRHSRIDNSQPDALERAEITDINLLQPHWSELVSNLKAAEMTDKQKHDILLRAWTRAFSYRDTQETFDQYSKEVSSEFNAQIVNVAEGNCGYAMRGFRTLLGAIGIPARELSSFLSDAEGKFNQSGNSHGIIQSYLDEKWIYVEPQITYLEEGYEIEAIPVQYRKTFEELIEAIPMRALTSPEQMTDLPMELPNILPREAYMRPITETVWKPIREALGSKKLLGTAIKSGAALYLTRDILIRLAPEVKAQAANILRTLTLENKILTSPSPSTRLPSIPFPPELLEVVNKINQAIPNISSIAGTHAVRELRSYLDAVTPEQVVLAVLLGGASFYAGRKYEKWRQNKAFALQPVVEQSAYYRAGEGD